MAISLSEKTLFLRLKETLIPDLEKVEDEYSAFDCVSKRYNAYIELKCRRTHYKTLMIEHLKYERILKEAKENKMMPVYINSTPNGVWSFNLEDLDIQWAEQMHLPATTEFENKQKITKVVGFLPLEKGKQLLDEYYKPYKS